MKALALTGAAVAAGLTLAAAPAHATDGGGRPDQVMVMPLDPEFFEWRDGGLVDQLGVGVEPGDVLDVEWRDRDATCVPAHQMCAFVGDVSINPGSALFAPTGASGVYPRFTGVLHQRRDVGPGFASAFADKPSDWAAPGILPDGYFWVSGDTAQYDGDEYTRIAFGIYDSWIETRLIEPVPERVLDEEPAVEETVEPDMVDESEIVEPDVAEPVDEPAAAGPEAASNNDNDSRLWAGIALVGAGLIAGVGFVMRRKERATTASDGDA